MTGKPAPRPTAETRPFWDGCARGELMVQRCRACDRAQFPPRAVCLDCGGRDLGWAASRGYGMIHSVSIVARAPSPVFKADVPYALALVDMEEGVRMMMTIVECDPAGLRIGLPVEIVFEPRGPDGLRVPQARPRTP